MNSSPAGKSFISGQLKDPAWAWSSYEPDANRPWELKWAGHLYRRAAFGATWAELQEALHLGPQKTVTKLLSAPAELGAFNRDLDSYEQAASQSASSEALRGWWLRRICQTPWPLLEQLTLFWHNHFALSNAQASQPGLMLRFIQSLRANALGNYGRLLEAMVNEPALLACLDARHGRQPRPSENVVRVLLEHFTVGPGQFSETDVQTATDALSGWFVSQNQLRYSAREHATRPGKLFGHAGAFEKADLVRLLTQQRATAQHLVGKLYRWFIAETEVPPDSLLAPLVDQFAANLEIAPLVETILRSNLFYSCVAYRQKIKTPVEFALSLIRPLNGMVGTVQLGADLARLGQDLYEPPTIEGWAGHKAWVNDFTLLARSSLIETLLATDGAYAGKLNPAVAVKSSRPKAETLFFLELLLQADVPESQRIALLNRPAVNHDDNVRARRHAMQVAQMPEFHLA